MQEEKLPQEAEEVRVHPRSAATPIAGGILAEDKAARHRRIKPWFDDSRHTSHLDDSRHHAASPCPDEN